MNWLRSLLVAGAAIAVGSGCGKSEAEAAEKFGQVMKEPSGLLGMYLVVGFGVFLILAFFSEQGHWQCLLNTVRYLGLVSIMVAPIYTLVMESMAFGIALALSGFMSTIVITVFFRPDLGLPPLFANLPQRGRRGQQNTNTEE